LRKEGLACEEEEKIKLMIIQIDAVTK